MLQEVFLRMHRSIATLHDEDRFGPWAYQIARRAIADHHRTTARHPAPGDATAPDLPAPAPDDDEATVERELARYLTPFVAMLPSPYREALTLTDLEGLTQREAATRLGLSLSGMKSRVQRGRVMLRRALEACCHIAQDVRGRVIGCEPRADGRLPASCCA